MFNEGRITARPRRLHRSSVGPLPLSPLFLFPRAQIIPKSQARERKTFVATAHRENANRDPTERSRTQWNKNPFITLRHIHKELLNVILLTAMLQYNEGYYN